MKRWKAILGVVTVFLLGVTVGVMLTGKFVELRVRDAIDAGPEEMTRMIERRLAQKLVLTPQQRAELRPILTRAQSQIRTLRRETEPATWEILEETRTEIRSSLTPEQVRTFDEMTDEARRRYAPAR